MTNDRDVRMVATIVIIGPMVGASGSTALYVHPILTVLWVEPEVLETRKIQLSEGQVPLPHAL